jgi:O-antigen/teichoic acid export membrane protein
MPDPGRHGRNVSWLLLVDVFGKVLGLFYFAYLFNKLTKTENEWYAFYISVFPVLMTLNSIGFHDVVSREVAKQRDRVDGLLASGVMLQLGVFAGLMAATYGLAGILGYPPGLRQVLVLCPLAAFLTCLAEMHSSVFAAQERFRTISIITATTRTASVAGSMVLLYLGYKVLAVAAFMALTEGVRAAVSYLVLQVGCGGFRFRPSLKDAGYLVRHGVPMAVGRFAGASYYRMDLPVLRSAASAQASEDYAVGPRFFVLLMTVPDVIERVFYPVLSRKTADSDETQRFAVERFMKIMWILAMPMAIGMTVLGARIVSTICGAEYASGVPTVIVFTWVAALSMIDRAAVVYLRAKARQELPMYAYGVAFVLKLALCFPVIRHFGIPGLLVLNAAGSAALTLCVVVMVRGVLPGWSLGRLAAIGWRPLAGAVIMGAALFPLREQSILLTVPIGAVIYGVALLALGTMDTFDRRVVAGLFGLNRGRLPDEPQS